MRQATQRALSRCSGAPPARQRGIEHAAQRTGQMVLEGNTVARQQAEQPATIKKEHQHREQQVEQAALEPGAGQQQPPETEQPATGADVDAGAGEQPDQQAAAEDDEGAGEQKIALRAQQHQAAQREQPTEVAQQVPPTAVQPGRQQDACQRLRLAWDQAEAVQCIAAEAVAQLHQQHAASDEQQQAQPDDRLAHIAGPYWSSCGSERGACPSNCPRSRNWVEISSMRLWVLRSMSIFLSMVLISGRKLFCKVSARLSSSFCTPGCACVVTS